MTTTNSFYYLEETNTTEYRHYPLPSQFRRESLCDSVNDLKKKFNPSGKNPSGKNSSRPKDHSETHDSLKILTSLSQRDLTCEQYHCKGNRYKKSTHQRDIPSLRVRVVLSSREKDL